MKYYMEYNSPLGTIYLECDENILIAVDFNKKKLASDSIKSEANKFKDAVKWLDIYFSGKIPDFTPEYKIENATPFRKQVIEILKKIPYGKTVTYNDVAKEIAYNNNIAKMSAQAVGGAVGWNPISIIIPCHRVIGSNGKLVGYGGGIDKKIGLLKIEKVI